MKSLTSFLTRAVAVGMLTAFGCTAAHAQATTSAASTQAAASAAIHAQAASSADGRTQTVVVDGQTGEPVTFASVFNTATGHYLGITDGNGCLPQQARQVPTVNVQHINYQPVTVTLDTLADGKMRLTPLVRTVKEVVVDRQQHDFVRLKVYVRHYVWMTDTLAKVTRGICHLYLKPQKSSGKPKATWITAEALINRSILEGKRRPLVRGVLNLVPTDFIHIDGPRQLKQLPADSVARKVISPRLGNWGLTYATFDWANKRCNLVKDSIFFDKPFTIPLTGYTMSNFFYTESYDIRYGAPKFATLTNFIMGMKIAHKKSGANINWYDEMYVLDADYASKADYERELKNNNDGNVGTLEEPEGLPAMNPNVVEAMKNMRELSLEERKELTERK